MLFIAFPDDGIFGLRHERIALLPRHRCEAAAFLPADLVEDDFGEFAFHCAPCSLGPNSGCRRLANLRSFRCLENLGCTRV